MMTVEEFAARLNRAGANIDRLATPILSGFATIVADHVEANAPKRTRRDPGNGLTQVRPGVLEVPSGSYLVGELRGTSQSSPKSRTFLADSFDDIAGPLAAEVAQVAVQAVTGRRVVIRRRGR